MVIPTLTGSCTGTYKMTIIKKYIAAAHFLADNVRTGPSGNAHQGPYRN